MIMGRPGKLLGGGEMKDVSKDELLAAFELDSEAGVAARDALISGAHFDLWLQPAPAEKILGITLTRRRNLQRRGRPTVGFTETLEALAEMGERGLLVAFVNDRERGGYFFQLFLDPDPLRVIGCIGVSALPADGSTVDRA
jgi:hypothetical protein